MLYCQRFFSEKSLHSIARIAVSPAKTPPISPGPMPPALIGLGNHAVSPQIMYPFATRQSFWCLTETCQLPVRLLSSLRGVISLNRSSVASQSFRSALKGFELLFFLIPRPILILSSLLG